MNLVDQLLDRLTMYRLMLYYLLFLVSFALILNSNRANIFLQTCFLLVFCHLFNKLFAKIRGVSPNSESFAITALILTLIIGPVGNFFLISTFSFLLFTSALAMASKYFLTINKYHLFNPAALAVIFSVIFLHLGASWWVGSIVMALPITLGGLLILRKTHRFTLVISFLIVYFLLMLATNPTSYLVTTNYNLVTSSPIIFFAFVMLIEPLTSPASRNQQIIYGVLAASLFSLIPRLLAFISFPLELSLVLGNLYSFFAAPHFHQTLNLVSQEQLAPNITSFHFLPEKKFPFIAGQYLKLTLPHSQPDSRGLRRFFTISSSPTEDEITITSKFSSPGSSFKKALQSTKPGDKLIATNPAGEFTLPRATSHMPLTFIAGGIGITPFRSIIKYLADTNQTWDIVLLYCAKSESEFVYKEIFANTKTIYKIGHPEAPDITTNIPDYLNRIYYLSGPPAMVRADQQLLSSLGISRFQIKTDFFPGYA